jgi:N-acetylmuramic acid 6-phosphate (MurNAc-6-P) etherase
MVQLGHVSGNLMSCLLPSSEKLRERAVRIVMALGSLNRARADALLDACDGDVAEATRRARRAADRGSRETARS